MSANVVWKPLPGSQELALSCPADEILYEGTRGPGKTDAQLMFFRRYVGVGYSHFWRGIIFDREYKNLDDLIAKSMRWFPAFGDGARFLASKSDYRWVWPTGEQLLFRQMKREQDYWNYHGQEFPFIGWNELCKQPSPHLYDMVRSCNRTSFHPREHSPKDEDGNLVKELPPLPLVLFSTTNPYGAGHNWVKRRFIDAGPPGKLIKRTVEVFNPRSQRKEKITKTQVRIFGSYKENRYLTPEYVAELESEKDQNRRRAWLHGDWNIVAGGALDDVWNESVQVLPRFQVPREWKVDRSLDWGSTKPFSVGWWAQTNGEEVKLPDGRRILLPANSLVRIFEYYGTKELGTNVGLKKSPAQVAKEVRVFEKRLLEQGWIHERPVPGPADRSIWNTERTDDGNLDSIALRMERAADIAWIPAKQGRGTRRIGLELIREGLDNTKTREGPGIYFMENCLASLALLPTIPRSQADPDDVDTEAEDHLYDEVRYRVLSGTRKFAENLDVSIPY